MTISQFELSPNSRFSISDNPNALPGQCALCGSVGGDGRQFVDWGFQLDIYGAVYFCTYCVTELAEAIGFVRQEKFLQVESNQKEAQGKLDSIIAEFKEYKDGTRAVLRNCNCPNELDTVLDDSRFGVFSGEDDEKSNSKPDEPDSGSDEFGRIEGLDDVQPTPRASKSRSTKSSK